MGERLFGTNGVRGVVNQLFTPEFALRLGQALGMTLDNSVLVAWDGRRGTPMATHALLAVLTAVGSDAEVVGPMPTPCLQFACKDRGRPGVMVTASHNPPEASRWSRLMAWRSRGIKKIWETGGCWVLVRPSGTEPMLRVFAEAPSEEQAAELATRHHSMLNKIVDELSREDELAIDRA